MEQLTQWRMDWLTYQELRTKSRQKINAWSDQLDGLIDGVRKHVGEDVDPKRIAPRRIQSRGVRKTTKKASVASDSTSDDDEESPKDATVFRCLRFRQLLRFLLALRPTNTAYYNFAMATIQEHDVYLMVVLAVSRMEDPIEGEERWPPWWKRSPELCWWITQDVVEWLAQIPEELKPNIAEVGIEISEEEDNVIRTLAEDAATHIMIDSCGRLDRFRGPRF
ncbi:hypothetical protein FIE12Z_10882 [Fusarium flagelliforme]|uniref:Uncharacterized protein n=1 Tax=Fusarium flagelliforme TaxID=2675880 RepID=A0A395MAK8_9HYPO|nr:hypothetical protein FIE12Z_10882 [Fusarium flagelliforme]